MRLACLAHKFHKGVKMCACRSSQRDVRATIGGVLIEPVPVLYRGSWHLERLSTLDHGMWAPDWALNMLATAGSAAAPGFMDPEGIVVFHEASGQLFKATIKGDEKPKGER